MHLTIMTSMFFHALESLCSNYSVSSIFRWCFIIAKRKEKRTQCEQEGKALHEKKKKTGKGNSVGFRATVKETKPGESE